MNTTKVSTCPTATPWGRAQNKTKIADGIFFASTASHGGFWLSQQRLNEMPEALREGKFTNRKNWFEEDCEYVRVVIAFPQWFPNIKEEDAKRTLKEYAWKAYEKHYGTELQPGESYSKDRDIFNSN